MSARPRSVRIYYPFFPYPLTEGAHWVVHEQVRTLTTLGWDVELVTWKDSAITFLEKVQRATSLYDDVSITRLSLAGVEQGNARDWVNRAPWEADSKRSGPQAKRSARVARSLASRWASPETFHYPPGLDPRNLLGAAAAGIYHYSFAYLWLRTAPARPEERVYVHFHNLESELAAVRATTHRPLAPEALVHRINARKLWAHERDLVHLADDLWFVSATDLRRFRSATGCDHTRLVPPAFDLDALANRRLAFQSRTGGTAPLYLGFVGGGHFEPNRASLAWIVDVLAPALARQSFSGRILVAGRDVPDQIRNRAARFGFFDWLGFVPNLDDFWSRLSFLLIPHIHGAGVRIKLLEALGSGIPVIANHAAVQAVAPDLRTSPLLWVAEEAEEWAGRIVREQPFRTRCACASVNLRGTSVDGRTVYEFLDAPFAPVGTSRR